MVASVESRSDNERSGESIEIQVREGIHGYMAWVTGSHHIYSIGRSPKEAIGALVSDYPFMFSVSKVYFR